MKKLCVLILIHLIVFNTTCFGAVSDDVYVRKDVFDVYMQSINAKLDMTLEQIKELREEMKAQRKDINELMKAVSLMSGRIDGLDKRMDSLDKRIDGQQNYLYLVLVILGIIVALPTVQKMLQWHEERKEARKSSITLEDVERLVERLIDARMAGKAQA